MADLTNALQSLGPIDFASVPTAKDERESFLRGLFSKSELIVESVPIPDATGTEERLPYTAANAAEVKPSPARSAAPVQEHANLQKEWGKPLKLGAKDNPLSISVYKKPAKDGKGAWFARRSVHEGIGFARFKRGLELEFEESLAVEGPPGTGNIRGIGGERRVENIDVPGLGNISVYRLSAQFPGPTTPRDFVTCLITSDDATDKDRNGPRHYMIISKPCDHPETQPTSDFIRGSYESVEFIREVPRKGSTSASTTDLAMAPGESADLGKEAIVRNATQKMQVTTGTPAEQPESGTSVGTASDGAGIGTEGNPVEWIMITRSDPGGSVPRFMVERGTPASIVADASKFLDWACGKDFSDDAAVDVAAEPLTTPHKPSVARRDSARSWRSSRVAGLDEGVSGGPPDTDNTLSTTEPAGSSSGSGIFGAVTETLAAYTPQAVLDHLPQAGTGQTTHLDGQRPPPYHDVKLTDDARSIQSTTSFASADSHLTSDIDTDSPESSSKHKVSEDSQRPANIGQHEREIAKLDARRTALQNKFSASRDKMIRDQSESAAKGEAAHQKAREKHDREMKKHDLKYEKELKKIENRKLKEHKKMVDKARRAADKDEKQKLTRERDEARAELGRTKQEADVLRKAVEKLQEENTSLVVQLGKAGVGGSEIAQGTKQGGGGDEKKGMTDDHAIV